MRTLTVALALIVTLSVGVTPAHATPILDFTGGDQAPAVGNQTLGWSFTLSTTVSVDALGFFDAGENGLFGDHIVALWSSGGGAPLAQTTVTNASTPVASTSADGRWLFQALGAPLVLDPGAYVIGADYSLTTDPVLIDTNAPTMASGFTFGTWRFVSAGAVTAGLDFPDASVGRVGVFGPNLSATEITAAPVPEPSTVALLGLGLVGAAVVRYRRRR